MFFIHIGNIIAWILVVMGTIRTGMGFTVAYLYDGEENLQASREYLAAANSGEAINEGMMYFVSEIVIGLLAKIAKSLNASIEE